MENRVQTGLQNQCHGEQGTDWTTESMEKSLEDCDRRTPIHIKGMISIVRLVMPGVSSDDRGRMES